MKDNKHRWASFIIELLRVDNTRVLGAHLRLVDYGDDLLLFWRSVIIRSFDIPFLVLIGLRGTQPYAPLRVMRQFGRRQIVPVTADMTPFIGDIINGVIPKKSEILQYWGRCASLEPVTMARDRFRAGCSPSYEAWLQKDTAKEPHVIISFGPGIEDREAAIEAEYTLLRKRALESEEAHRVKDEKTRADLESLKLELNKSEEECKALKQKLAETSETHKEEMETVKEGIAEVFEVIEEQTHHWLNNEENLHSLSIIHGHLEVIFPSFKKPRKENVP